MRRSSRAGVAIESDLSLFAYVEEPHATELRQVALERIDERNMRIDTPRDALRFRSQDRTFLRVMNPPKMVAMPLEQVIHHPLTMVLVAYGYEQ